MAIRDLFAKAPQPQTLTVDAAATPAPFNNSVQNYFYPLASASRQQAMAVPTIARARNIICSTVASLPLEQRIKSSGVRVEPNRVINQPDSRVPGSSIYSYIAEDLLFHGVAYGQVLSMYADGRVQE